MSTVVIRCAILCVSCDLPTGRKLCGFLGHFARHGCSKCLKEFQGSIGKINYSGFEHIGGLNKIIAYTERAYIKCYRPRTNMNKLCLNQHLDAVFRHCLNYDIYMLIKC